jgi:hypothetical protein
MPGVDSPNGAKNPNTITPAASTAALLAIDERPIRAVLSNNALRILSGKKKKAVI